MIDHTLMSLTQEEVDKLVVEKYDHDDCKPVFIVSIFKRMLILTCKHNSVSFSEKIFPGDDMEYGLISLRNILNNLYDRTM